MKNLKNSIKKDTVLNQVLHMQNRITDFLKNLRNNNKSSDRNYNSLNSLTFRVGI